MQSAFILQHSYEKGDCEETKFIGVYSSREQAEAAVERLRLQPGFRNRPNDFHIDEYELNQDHWQKGYVVSLHVCLLDKNGEQKVIGVSCLPGDLYQIVDFDHPDDLGEFKNLDVVHCEERDGSVWVTELVERTDKRY